MGPTVYNPALPIPLTVASFGVNLHPEGASNSHGNRPHPDNESVARQSNAFYGTREHISVE
jgi:hypothetical protein